MIAVGKRMRLGTLFVSFVLSLVFLGHMVNALRLSLGSNWVILNAVLLGLVLVFFLYPLLMEVFRRRFKIPDETFGTATLVWLGSVIAFFVCVRIFMIYLYGG
ncbi:MAG: hypothetical protein Q7R47_01835 [Candidatus Diapherotrites archaeon]|nr:hypothetical protein [Candidatus Diapherotrites archaeon]